MALTGADARAWSAILVGRVPAVAAALAPVRKRLYNALVASHEAAQSECSAVW